MQRIEKLDCDNRDKTLASCDPAAAPPMEAREKRTTLERAGVDDAAFVNSLLTTWRELVCGHESDAIHILHGILHARLYEGFFRIPGARLLDTGREAPAFVDFIMSKDCPVSAALTDDDKAVLLKIKQDAEQKSAPPSAAKKEK